MPTFGAEVFQVASVAVAIFAGVSGFSVAGGTRMMDARNCPCAATSGEVVKFEHIEEAFACSIRATDDFWNGGTRTGAAFVAEFAHDTFVIVAVFLFVVASASCPATIEIASASHFASRGGFSVAVGVAIDARLDLAHAIFANRMFDKVEGLTIRVVNAFSVGKLHARFTAVFRIFVCIFVSVGANAALRPMALLFIDAYTIAFELSIGAI